MYACGNCKTSGIADYAKLCEAVLGARWWSWPDADAQALIVLWLLKDGVCARHSTLLAAIAILTVREVRARRAVLPGTVEVRDVVIDVEPFETIPPEIARQHGAPLVDRVRAFVAGSSLRAVVEMDLKSKRARVTLELVEELADPASTVIESPRLVHLDATELVTVLRARRVADRA